MQIAWAACVHMDMQLLTTYMNVNVTCHVSLPNDCFIFDEKCNLNWMETDPVYELHIVQLIQATRRLIGPLSLSHNMQ